MIVRTLFVKIYLWFCLAMLLVLGVVTLTVRQHEGGVSPSGWRLMAENSINYTGKTIVHNFEAQGKAGLESIIAAKAKELTELYLFREGEELTGQTYPPAALRLAKEVQQKGPLKTLAEGGQVFIAAPVEGTRQWYVIVEQTHKKRSTGKQNKMSSFIPFKILGILALSAMVCYALSRYLTDPIMRIRNATRRLANGELSVRVRPGVGRRNDELAELASDFDIMAERIGLLLNAQRQLIADISHELRSPLTRLNMALYLSRQQAGEGATRHLDRIGYESERLNELIGHLLELSRLETGLNGIEFVLVDLTSLVQDITKDADFEARSRGCSVAAVTSTVTVAGIPELLRRAIENVVRNAVRHTKQGTQIEIAMNLQEDPPGVLISVRDHGPGVSEMNIEKIFQPFFRVDDARDRRTGGAGLGLAIAERAVRLHGGTIRAYNHSSGGLVVELLLHQEQIMVN